MGKGYWLMKSEPDVYAYAQLEKDKKTRWDGVRNFEARNNLRAMKKGDLAFFYDRNGLWHNYLPHNLRIVLLNNHAGGIFRLIDGPNQQQELEPYFETHQALNAENTAKDFGFAYTSCRTLAELTEVLPAFFAPVAGPSILEIFTDSKANAASFAGYKQALLRSFQA